MVSQSNVQRLYAMRLHRLWRLRTKCCFHLRYALYERPLRYSTVICNVTLLHCTFSASATLLKLYIYSPSTTDIHYIVNNIYFRFEYMKVNIYLKDCI